MSLMNIVMNDMISDVEPVLAVLKYELIIILSLNCIRLDTYVDVSSYREYLLFHMNIGKEASQEMWLLE